MKKWKINFIFIFFVANFTFSQSTKTVIPFQLTSYNNISITTIINEKDTVQLMFHTAANSVTLTEEVVKRLKNCKFNKKIDSIKSWGGNQNEARVSESNLLQIGKLKWEDISIIENKNSGKFTDGKFGIDLFKNKAIQIDFDKNQLIISNHLPKKLKNYQKLKLYFENEMMFIDAKCTIENSILTNKFLLHSGYSGGVLLDDVFSNTHNINQKLKIIEKTELKDSFGNILYASKAILPEFTFGNNKLINCPVSFFDGAIGKQKISAMGGEVLKKFNWIFDSKREYVYIKRNKIRD